MNIVIGSDHGGYEYKEAVKRHLNNEGYTVIDVGTNSKDSCDYPIFGIEAAKKVASGEAVFGVIICTSGEGIMIAANKVKGIRCGLGYDDEATEKCREHNDCNMISFGAHYMKLSDVLKRVDIFLTTPFIGNRPDGERHLRRVNEINDLDK